MNRIEIRHKANPALNTLGILAVCQNLRMSCSGASDPWEHEAAAKAWLRVVLDTWQPTLLDWMAHFDAAVNELVKSTLVEACREEAGG